MAGCQSRSSQSPTSQPQPLKVITTILPMYLFTKAVVGDAAAVTLLIPPGSEVHEYQSKPADVQELAQADVLVRNGLGLEDFLAGTVRSAQNPNLVEITASQGIKPLDSANVVPDHSPSPTDPDQADQGNLQGNPHIWLDPVRAQEQVKNIRDGLIKADPAQRQIYETNAAAYIQKLQQLDQQFQQQLQACKTEPCRFIILHDAFPYLANRYHLQQVAIVEIPEDSFSPGDIQRVITLAKRSKVQALFREPGVDNQALTNLSSDLNLKLEILDPLESGNLNPQYYFTAMEKNLQTLKRAFE